VSLDVRDYRQIVRNATETPTALERVRRWTHTPMLYLKTVDEAGVAIDDTTLATVEATAKESVPEWTGSRFGVPIVERGTGTREGQAGWITIKFPATNTAPDGYCGRADVGREGGSIELSYTRVSSPNNCRLGHDVIGQHVVRHEMGHALGFWHTATEGDLMYQLGSWYSRTGHPTARELAYAAIAYQRPIGNTDPDSDPIGAVTLQPLSVR
jgi:hypothetical protein